MSRVLNNTAHVRDSVRARVLETVAALGYEMPIKRITAHASSIAVVIADILNPFFPEVLRGIEDELGIGEFDLSLFDTTEIPGREQEVLDTLGRRSPEGIIVCGSRLASQDLIALISRYKTPLVVLNRRLSHPQTICITADAVRASGQAVRHLLNLNHARIGYLAGSGDSEMSKSRRGGMESALGEAGLSLKEEWCPSSFPNVDGGFQAMSKLLALPISDRPTAVIAFNDIMALGAMHAIRSHRLRVPEDISVVGFDDIAMASHANPPLTTVSQPRYQMGQLAMRMLRQMIQGETHLGGSYTLVESPLIVRESTAPLGLTNPNHPPAAD